MCQEHFVVQLQKDLKTVSHHPIFWIQQIFPEIVQ